MGVALRLQRVGKKHEPHYRVVAIDKRRPRDGEYLELLGHYRPRYFNIPAMLKLDAELVKKYLSNGATPSNTVSYLIAKAGICTLEPGQTSEIQRLKQSRPKTEQSVIPGSFLTFAETSITEPSSGKNIGLTDNNTGANVDIGTSQQLPRKAQKNEVTRNRAWARSPSVARPRPIVDPEPTVPHSCDDILRCTLSMSADDCVREVASAGKREVYIEVEPSALDAAVQLATDIHFKIMASNPLWEPVVVGPLPPSDSDTRKKLAQIPVRSTTKTFEEYCRDHARLPSSSQCRQGPRGRFDRKDRSR